MFVTLHPFLHIIFMVHFHIFILSMFCAQQSRILCRLSVRYDAL